MGTMPIMVGNSSPPRARSPYLGTPLFEKDGKTITQKRSWRLGSIGVQLFFVQSAIHAEKCDFVVEADINDDGVVDPLDSGLVLTQINCVVGSSSDCDEADVNDDGQVNPLDVGFVVARAGCTTNVALGKPYTLSHDPNYSLTESETDNVELTDGYAYFGTSKLWILKETVSWAYIYDPVIVTIDLGEVFPINAVSFHTGGGASGSFLPATVQVWVSDDQLVWHYASTLSSEAVPQTALLEHTFLKSDLATRGRYVSVCMLPAASNIYCDEIEVFAGDHDPDTVTFADPAVYCESGTDPCDSLSSAVDEQSLVDVEVTASLYLIDAAISSISGNPGGDLNGTLEALADQEAVALATTDMLGDSRAIGVPFTSLDAETCAIVGAYYEQTQLDRLQVWAYGPTEDLLPFDRPLPGQDQVSLEAHMMLNEHEHVSFVLTNNSSEYVDVILWNSVDTDGPIFGYREGLYYLAPGYQLIPDPLPRIKGSTLELPPGLSKEVWVELDSKYSIPGSYSYTISAFSSLGDMISVPLDVTIYDPVMVDNPEYMSYSFASFYIEPIRDYPEAVAEDLAEHYSNVHILKSTDFPSGWVDDAGKAHLPDDEDFAYLESIVAMRPEVRFWILSTNFQSWPMDSLLTGEQVHEDTFKAWVELLNAKFNSWGVGSDQWAIMLVDEPTLDEWESIIVPMATWTKELETDILIYQNWSLCDVEKEVLEDEKNATPLVDVYVPTHSRVLNDTTCTGELLDLIPEKMQPSGKYDSGSAPDKDPLNDYRLSHWHAWNWGLNANGKWTYVDFEQDVWREYVGSIQAMIYPGEDEPITSRRWEAWRDGIEDHELIGMITAHAVAEGDTALLDEIGGALDEILCTSDTSGDDCVGENVLQEIRVGWLSVLTN